MDCCTKFCIGINLKGIKIKGFFEHFNLIFKENEDDFKKIYKSMLETGLNKNLLECEWKKILEQFPNNFYIVGGLCWENIILPIYFLNGNKLSGEYKVLTNYCSLPSNNNGEMHFVIYESKNKYILDPTYEKCNITKKTKKKLGNNCCYFDLKDYLDSKIYKIDLAKNSKKSLLIKDYIF